MTKKQQLVHGETPIPQESGSVNFMHWITKHAEIGNNYLTPDHTSYFWFQWKIHNFLFFLRVLQQELKCLETLIVYNRILYVSSFFSWKC